MCEDIDISLIISVVSLVVSVVTTIIALKYTRTQLLLSIAPELWSNGVNYYTPQDDKITFNLSNRGHIAKIYELKIKKGEITHNSNCFPFDLNTNDEMNLYFRYTGNGDKKKSDYKIKIYYKDKNNNKHSVILSNNNSKTYII